MLLSSISSALLLALAVNANPTSLTKRAAVAGKIPVSWSGYNWLGTVLIGGQEVKLIIDAGSEDTWVISDADPNRPATGYYTQPSPSLAPVLPYAVWNVTYADGSGGSGVTVVVDTITSPSSSLSIPGQSIELANSVAQAASGAVGMMGLGFARSLEGNWLGNSVKNSSTGVRIPQNTTWQTSRLGYFTTNLPASGVDLFVGFGIDDTSKYSGPLTYAPIDKKANGWVINATSSKVGSTVIPHTYLPVLLDTGTALSRLDNATVGAIYSHIPDGKYDATNGWQFNCTATLPQISLGFGTSSYVNLNMTTFNWSKTSGGYCKGTIQSLGATQTRSIYGTSFFRSVYVKWDGVGAQVGFAPYV